MNKFPTPSNDHLYFGLTLAEVKATVAPIRAGTFHWIELKEGAVLPIPKEPRGNNLIVTRCIPVRFKCDVRNTRVYKLEHAIRVAASADDIATIDKILELMPESQVNTIAANVKALLATKKDCLASGKAIHKSEKRAYHASPTDTEHPYINLCANGSVTLTCLRSFRHNLAGGTVSSFFRLYRTKPDGSVEEIPVSSVSAKDFQALVEKARIAAGKKVVSGEAHNIPLVIKPAIQNIVGIY